MHVSTILSPLLFLLPLTTLAKFNGPCTGAANKPGVCIKTSSCTSGGGTYISGACPNDPNDVKCCTKASCGSGGTCKFVDKCESGSTKAGLCPGPSDFKCCLPKSGGSGFPPPNIPGVGACKKVAVEGAKKIVAKNKGKVREIGCVRNCKCGAAGASDHCCGLAIDLMCSKAAGVKTDQGKSIAEWAMRNHGSLKLTYVIFGQRIWNPSRDAVGPWSGWRKMEDRGSVTANHWDHVHVSFKG
ncbi:putative secreted protein [Lasiodiplodia theobromae]|uniref:Putative secreted protein n=1 Tax=Lasiodiplodia theobromae TaxID=45133 RepID=A0A5N5DH45_9PEZI|nr:putative secreted protein [Lasiodiplodia theobromae]